MTTRCRVRILVLLHVLNACEAASTAALNSSDVVSGTRVNTVCVDYAPQGHNPRQSSHMRWQVNNSPDQVLPASPMFCSRQTPHQCTVWFFLLWRSFLSSLSRAALLLSWQVQTESKRALGAERRASGSWASFATFCVPGGSFGGGMEDCECGEFIRRGAWAVS
jgi:hypothetical protein